MSCPHGNHPDNCDICDEVAAAYNSGVEHTKREWIGLDWGKTEDKWINSIEFLAGARWAEAKLKEKNI